MDHLRLDVGEVALHVASDGSGPPVVLLHGFPEHWIAWREQLPALAAAGFRALAPDLRGYNDSDRPRGLLNYTLEKLAADVAGLVRAVGGRASIVGHDWGGTIAFAVAHLYPELVDKLVVLNAPHPTLVWRKLLDPRQAARLWHTFFFQLPWLPENRVAQRWFFPRALRGLAVDKAAFPDALIAEYRAAFEKPGAREAALAYYRAFPFSRVVMPGRIRARTLLVWGEVDKILPVSICAGLDRYVGDFRIEKLPDAGHWVQHDRPAKVSALLTAFLEDK